MCLVPNNGEFPRVSQAVPVIFLLYYRSFTSKERSILDKEALFL